MSPCDCDQTPKPQGLSSLEQARQRLLDRAEPLSERERLPLAQGLDRILAEPVQSHIAVPSWDNSAMDGYAVRASEIPPEGAELRISQRIPAGTAGDPLEPGTAARIFTGAPIPPGADTVVIQEICRPAGEKVWIPGDLKVGANIRRTGEDIQAGAQILPAGTRLAPQHLGLAASVGVAQVSVYRRLRVAVFSSGDELVMPGQPLAPGKIYNSNRFLLAGLLQRLGCEVMDLGTVEDNLEATKRTLGEAAERADLVLATGGVSVGEEDHVKPAVEAMGSLDLWKLAIRPGKPLAFGHIGARRTPFIGHPGNPVSLFVTFCLLTRPFVQRQQGMQGDLSPKALSVRADFDWPKAGKRREFLRARLVRDAQGQAWVQAYPSRSSAVLSSVVWADGLAVIPEGCTFQRGDRLDFIPFCELGA